MNSKVLYFKGLCAALIPATSTAAAALAIATKDYPDYSFGFMLAVVALNTSNAAFSGLSSFLSRTFADHTDAQNGKTPT